MRRLLCVVSLVASAAGCTDIFALDDYTTRHPSPGGVDESIADAPLGATSFGAEVVPGTPASCATNLDCNEAIAVNGHVPSICFKSSCRALVTPECPRVFGRYTSADAIVVGAILDPDLERAAALAAKEIDELPPATPGGKARPLVVVACDASLGAMRAGHHLVEKLHVPAVMGPVDDEDVVGIAQKISVKAGALVLTPTSQSSALSNLADDGLAWRGTPSDNQRASLVIQQMGALEEVLRSTRSLTSVKLGIVHRTDALGLSARDAIAGKLVINGRFIGDAANASFVSIDAYESGAASSVAGIVARYAGTFRPDLVYVTAPEQVTELVGPLERALVAARVVNKPYYVIAESAKSRALLDLIAAPDMPADLRRRIRGIGAVSDTSSATPRAGFEARYLAEYGAKPATYADATTYDGVYALAYAIAATKGAKPTGAGIAAGLRNLGVGSPIAVGPENAAQTMTSLGEGKSVALRGANTLMRWDERGDIAGGTVEVWCVGTSTGAPAFGGAGVAMDVETQVVGGYFVQCQ